MKLGATNTDIYLMQAVKVAFVLCSMENCQLCWSQRNKDKRRIVQSLLYSREQHVTPKL